MGLKYTQGFLLLVLCASMLGVSVANRNWQYGWNSPKHGHRHPKYTDTPKKIVVGGSANWTFGFDYTVWAFRNGPFYLNDTLVFKYDLPKDNSTHPHSVYLLPDLWSFLTCNLTEAVMIADGSQGGGNGFEFVLNKWQPYFFACGGGEGIHCNLGKMKFYVLPLLRRWHY
ncbi:uncharacterized protein LOC8283277 [Ricinus communis]|uniref:Phytocyanin domain-containing protein n=1 Tax=Ricinus communis TaxID=3988 RepID=B9S780_RICCO|nr:uncharacterized protein LOC8283277 [Ricinus communis]EEF40485.1 conserved hypothetical protein [Ricinus communis]|eukprot:XP_002521849.1 uncharacterized protein LOC8283277 [Ricinus communis]